MVIFLFFMAEIATGKNINSPPTEGLFRQIGTPFGGGGLFKQDNSGLSGLGLDSLSPNLIPQLAGSDIKYLKFFSPNSSPTPSLKKRRG